MPAMQMMVHRLNTAFSRPAIDELADGARLFVAGARLSEAARSLRILPEERAVQDLWLTILDGLPPSIHDALRSVIHTALTARPRPTPIVFAWAPGYDFEVTVWQAPDTKLTPGGITVLIRTRYPDDRHPLAGSPKRSKRRS
jgi:hypothetical protein